MSYGSLIQEAVEDTSGDMGNVQQAADAITDAIAKLMPVVDSQTWRGTSASTWENGWRTLYGTVQRTLGDLPSAETNVINDVREQMDKLAARQRT